jgi:hypothetical protein
MAKSREDAAAPLRVIGECYPSNFWYESTPDTDDIRGGTVWQGLGFWKMHEMRSNVAS